MTRAIGLLIGLCSLAIGQDVKPEAAFLNAIGSLEHRVADGQPVDPVSRLREELGFSIDSAEALLSTSRDYLSGLQAIDTALRRSILERRMRVMAGDSVISEPELLAQANKRRGVLLENAMQELRSKLGTREGQSLRRFLEEGSQTGEYFPLRPDEKRIARVN